MDRARSPGEEVTRIGAVGGKSLAGACLFFLTWSLALAHDRELYPDRIEFVVGNIVFVTLHELSHLVVEDFDLCYQLVQAFDQLSEEQSVKELVEKIRTYHRDKNARSENEP